MSAVQAVLWDARCLKPSHRLEGHGGVVMAADLTDSATTAFTGAGDGVRHTHTHTHTHTALYHVLLCVGSEGVGCVQW